MVRATLLVDKYLVAELAVSLGGETFLEAVLALSPVEGSVEEDGKVLVQADLPSEDYNKLVYYDQLANNGGLTPDVEITEYALEDLGDDFDEISDAEFIDVEPEDYKPVGKPTDESIPGPVPPTEEPSDLADHDLTVTDREPVESTGDFLAGTTSV